MIGARKKPCRHHGRRTAVSRRNFDVFTKSTVGLSYIS